MNELTRADRLDFWETCERVKTCLDSRWKGLDDFAKMQMLEREKAAILGSEAEMNFYKEEIAGIIAQQELGEVIPPPWYRNLTDGIFAEL